MPSVELAFSAAPEYVRTARLVGVAVARRAGVADELLADLQLAIGEACGQAVARHERHGITALIRVEMSDEGPYQVRVIDACAPDREPPGAAGAARADGPARPAADDGDEMGAALLAGLVDDLQVTAGPDGTEVRMTWPVRRRLVDTTRW